MLKILAFGPSQAIHYIQKCMRMNGLLKSLTQQVLPALARWYMLEDRQDEIVTHQTFGGGEEAQIAHDDMSLGVAKAIASPDFNVLCHRKLRVGIQWFAQPLGVVLQASDTSMASVG